MEMRELLVAILRRGGSENKVADVRDAFAFADAKINLTRTGINADSACLLHEIRGKILLTRESEDGVFDVGVGQNRFGANDAAVAGDDAACDFLAFAFFDQDFIDEDFLAQLDAVFLKLGDHFFDQIIGTTTKRINTRAHEVREHNSEGDRGVIEIGAIGIRDRLHEQTVHVGSAREEAIQHLPRRLGVVVVIIHRPQVVVESLYLSALQFKLVDEHARVIFAGERRPDVHLRIYETDVF